MLDAGSADTHVVFGDRKAAVVGAIAVVASLIYLATQIRQNTRSVRSATYQGLFDHIADFQNLFLLLNQSLNLSLYLKMQLRKSC